ncbi:unnamed protein product [Sphenostylis stenocarpa]|uniref:Uncharacterized protein n=1 Tax=Sphenostylis stenocarpa TaxID=92480 RepID=A0AA86SEY5_9FABA|nr:unnamed protein product [Sphenostylis stenocarpa]
MAKMTYHPCFLPDTTSIIEQILQPSFTRKIMARIQEGCAVKIDFGTSCPGQEKHLCAEELSSTVVTKMREIAEAYRKQQRMQQSAYFNDSQHKATVDEAQSFANKKKEDFSSAISRATHLLDGNNQKDDIVVFQDYLEELVSIMNGIKAMDEIG